MSMPLIPPFAVTASYQDKQYGSGSLYTPGVPSVFDALVTPPSPGTTAEAAADTAAHAKGWVAPSARNEVQVITLTGAVYGTFTVHYSAAVSAPIAYNASNTDVQTALQGMTSIGTGNATVTGNAGGPWTVTFAGALADTDVALMTLDISGINVATVTVATSVPGVAPTNEVQIVTLTDATGGTFKLTYSSQQTAAIAFDATAAAVQSALEALSNIAPGDVAVTGDAGGPYSVEFTGTLAGTNVTEMTADAASLTGTGTPTCVVTTDTAGDPGTNEQQTVTLARATGGTFTLTLGVGEGTPTTTPIAYNAPANTGTGNLQAILEALSNVGAGNVGVSGSAGGPYTVEFKGDLASTNMSQMTANASGLTHTADTGAVAASVEGRQWVNHALLDQSRQRDGMRDFYDSASGMHF